MKRKEIRKTITLHERQYNAFHFTKRYGAAICGKRSGKTFVGALWAAKQIDKAKEPTKGLILAPTYKILDQAALDTLFTQFPEWRKYHKMQKGTIELPRGDIIYLRSAEDPNSIEGLTIDWAWVDEAGQMKRDIWRIVRARVSTTKGQVFFTTTPYTMNWLYYELYLPWFKKEDPDIEIFKWKTIDNPVFRLDEENKRFIEEERRRLSPVEFEREYEGEFTRLEGLVWDLPSTSVIEENPVLQKVMTYPDTVIGGIDWGFHNPTGILIAFVKDSVFYVVDEWKMSEKTTAEIIEKSKEFEQLYKVRLWFPDPAEPDRIEEMKRAGLRIGEVNKDVPLGLSHVASLIKQGKLYVHSRCRELLDETSQYVYEEVKDGRPTKEHPVKVNDHLCDALRYLCIGHRPTDPKMLMRAAFTQRRINTKRFE